MKVKAVPSAWLSLDGRRFDCSPYMSGALEAKVRLEELPCRKDSLASLCVGGVDGIYHAGRESRTWVDDPEAGVPFLSSSSILACDLSGLPLISKRQVASNPMFTLRRGWTLITRSGTIGRMVYARPDMDGLACSEHVMRVVPDPQKVEPGFVYAFLSSKFGRPLVISGTYGSIIQSIEPQHIADLPVPRLGDNVEREAHRLVELAATSRTHAAQILAQELAKVEALLGRDPQLIQNDRVWSAVESSRLQSRFDAYYHSRRCAAARRAFDTAAVPEHRTLGDVADVFIPGIFKRRYADDSSFGVPYITGGDVFQLAPTSERFLISRVATEYRLVVEKGTILIQEAGQLGGLIGKSVFVGRHLDGFAVSNNMVRVTADDARDAGFIFALLSTPEGVTLVSREAAGSSIPHMDAARLRALSLPWPDEKRRHETGTVVATAIDLRDAAAEAEDEARALVEREIAGAG